MASTWQGVANGPAYTMSEKAGLRAGADLPEDNERQLRQQVAGAADYVKQLWRAGRVDLLTSAEGLGSVVMTSEQAAWWKGQTPLYRRIRKERSVGCIQSTRRTVRTGDTCPN